jgi:hypothetical protein
MILGDWGATVLVSAVKAMMVTGVPYQWRRAPKERASVLVGYKIPKTNKK